MTRRELLFGVLGFVLGAIFAELAIALWFIGIGL